MRILRTLVLVAVVGAAAGAQPAGLKKDIIAQLNDAEVKLTALAKVIPDAKWNWRPADGIRSFSEVYVHVALENLDIPPLTGVAASSTKPAEGAEKSITQKAAVIDLLTKSFAYARQSVNALPDAQMDASANYFGTPTSKRGIMLNVAVHGHEHLGQLIAYSRMNGIVPPW